MDKLYILVILLVQEVFVFCVAHYRAGLSIGQSVLSLIGFNILLAALVYFTIVRPPNKE